MTLPAEAAILRGLVVSAATAAVLACAGAASAAGPISSGEELDDAISVSMEVDAWSFTAGAGDAIVVRVSDLADANGFDPWIQLYAPGGAELGSEDGTQVSEIAITAPTEGTYSVHVSDGGFSQSGTGTYRLRLAKVPAFFAVGDEGGALANGGNDAGAITRGDLDIWSFTATVGDAIVVRLSQATDEGSFDPSIRLFGPQGEMLHDGWDSVVEEASGTAPGTGTYYVLVSDGGFSLGGTGTYVLQLAKVPGELTIADDGGSLANGGNHDAGVTAGDLDIWTFHAEAGDPIVLRVSQTTDDGNSLDPAIWLFGPSGEPLAGTWDTLVAEVSGTAPASGTYTVLTGDGGFGLAGTGSCRVQLMMPGYAFVAGDDGGALLDSQTQAGTVSRGDLDPWTFLAEAGSVVSIGLLEVTDDAGFEPAIRLYDPTGELLEDAWDTESIGIEITATVTGRYTVLVGDAGPSLSGTGTYLLAAAGVLDFVCDEAIDHDGDSIGDACDLCAGSAPGDGPTDHLGCNCTQKSCVDPNPCNGLESCNTDSGHCEAGISVASCDSDHDFLIDEHDNCPLWFNPFQEDSDEDGVGNYCDNCWRTANADQVDENSNRVGDACEPSALPSITSLDPVEAGVSQVVRIAGTGFGATKGASRVTIGEETAVVRKWSRNRIDFVVPNVPLGEQPVEVHTGAGTSNSVLFFVTGASEQENQLRARINKMTRIVKDRIRNPGFELGWVTLLTLEAFHTLESMESMLVLSAGRDQVALVNLTSALSALSSGRLDEAERLLANALVEIQRADRLRVAAADFVIGRIDDVAQVFENVHFTTSLITGCGFAFTRTPWLANVFDYAETMVVSAGRMLAEGGEAGVREAANAQFVKHVVQPVAEEFAGKALQSDLVRKRLLETLLDPALASRIAADSTAECGVSIATEVVEQYLGNILDLTEKAILLEPVR